MSNTKYLPVIAWRTIVQNVVMLTATTYRIDALPVDENEPGATDRDIGNYFKDYIGHTYLIIASTSTTIDLEDSFECGVGPQTDQVGIVYQSVDEGNSPFLAPVYYTYLDPSALDYSRTIELAVLFELRNANKIIPDTTNFASLFDETTDTLQKALEIIDDHNHDSRYYTETEINNILTAYETITSAADKYVPYTGATKDVNLIYSDLETLGVVKAETSHHWLKKVVFFGDSFSNDTTDFPAYTAQYLGLSAENWILHATGGHGMDAVVTALLATLSGNPNYLDDIDIVNVLAGVNDFAGAYPLGTIESAVNSATFAGKMKKFIETVLTANPELLIYFCTPPECDTVQLPYKSRNASGWTLSDLRDLIIEVADYYSVNVVDLYATSGFNELTIPSYTVDQLHPGIKGEPRLGRIVAQAMKQETSVGQKSESKRVTGKFEIRSNEATSGLNALLKFQSTDAAKGMGEIFSNKAGFSYYLGALNTNNDFALRYLASEYDEAIANSVNGSAIDIFRYLKSGNQLNFGTAIQLNNLAGTGTRLITASSAGLLSTSAIDLNTIPTAGGTLNYTLVGNGTTSAPVWDNTLYVDKANHRAGVGTSLYTNLNKFNVFEWSTGGGWANANQLAIRSDNWGGGSDTFGMEIGYYYDYPTAYGGRIQVKTAGTGGRLVINPDGGKVVIGNIAYPLALFNIDGDFGTTEGYAYFPRSGSATDWYLNKFNSAGNTSIDNALGDGRRFQIGAEVNWAFVANVSLSGGVSWDNNSWINNGNFGLGTTSPDEKLTVVGKTKTTNFQMTNGASSSTINYVLKCNDADGNAVWASASVSESYRGTWSASTNTPTLANTSGTAGYYYICSAAGTVDFGAGNITFAVGDRVSYNGTVWQFIAGVGYTLQTASSTVLGGVKIGTGVSIDGNGVISVSTAYRSSTWVPAWGDITSNPFYFATLADGNILRYSSANARWENVPSPFLTANQTITLSGIVTGSGTTAITTAIADAALTIAKTDGLQTALNAKEAAITTGTTAQFWRGDKTFQTLNTTVVPEGTNFYYTTSRFNSDFSAKSTTDLAEGNNLYYTNARAQAAISSSATGLTYTNSTGVFSFTSGYSIPLSVDTGKGVTAFGWGNHAGLYEAANANIQAHISSTSNPHSVTKSQVGLGNVLNLDTSNPANISQSATYRFVTDTEKTNWNTAYTNNHTHSNKSTLDAIEAALTTALKSNYDTAYSHSQSTHQAIINGTGFVKASGTTLSYDNSSYQPLATVLTNTTASFTTTLESKLNGIAAGAEVNVNADWNSSSGDSQILNKPTLGTFAGKNYPTWSSGTQLMTMTAAGTFGLTDTFSIASPTNNQLIKYNSGTGYWEKWSPSYISQIQLELPSIFNPTSNTSVLGSGYLSISLAQQTHYKVFAGPSSPGSAYPAFRYLVSADIPDLDAAKVTTGVFNTARLGTGTANNTVFLCGDGTWATPSGSSYTLPLAANGTRGGIQTGFSEFNNYLAVQLSSEKAYVSLSKSAIESVLTGAITSHTHNYDNYQKWSFYFGSTPYDITSLSYLQFQNGNGFNASFNGAGLLTLAASDAAYTTKGVASFSSSHFVVSSGAVSIGNTSIVEALLGSGAVTSSKLNRTAITGQSAVTTLTGSEEFILDNGSALKKITAANLKGYIGTGYSDVSTISAQITGNSSAVLPAYQTPSGSTTRLYAIVEVTLEDMNSNKISTRAAYVTLHYNVETDTLTATAEYLHYAQLGSSPTYITISAGSGSSRGKIEVGIGDMSVSATYIYSITVRKIYERAIYPYL